ncbi:GTP cyclohydrolase I [Paenibacillus chartarius]|uniref:GTP cyclohydrolase I n=1 Tax=Paenibacillus chartarius TaxID=747481 RepID=A0ABV6DLT5_9BACL
MNPLLNNIVKPTEPIQECIRSLLREIGEVPAREGLRDTPKRVAEMYKEEFAGVGDAQKGSFRRQYRTLRGIRAFPVKGLKLAESI